MQSTGELLVAAQGARLLSARQPWGCSLTLMSLPRLLRYVVDARWTTQSAQLSFHSFLTPCQVLCATCELVSARVRS